MTPDEIRAFLLTGTRTGKVAVTRRDGAPLVVPIWFLLDDDGTVVFTTGEKTVKGRALRRDSRLSMCVDEDAPPYAYVRVDGRAELSDHAGDLLRWATAIGARYMGADRGDDFGRRNAVPGELLVRVRPTRVVGLAEIAAEP